MNTIIYLVQVSACTGIFYLFYHLLLSRLTFFTINRWYLLGTLVISFMIPLISIPADRLPQAYQVSPISFSNVPKIYTYAGDLAKSDHLITEHRFDWFSLLPNLYFLVAGVLALYLVVTLLILLKRINSDQSSKAGNIKLVKGNKRYNNGSFFNCIFINDDALSPSELEQVIAHELVHIEQKHSIDKIISRITQVILWFNPFAYAYSNAINANHEYEVDHKVAQDSDKEQYAQLILRLASSGDGPLYHHFSKFPLSRRIALLFHRRTKKIKTVLYVLVLPLVLVSCILFANRKLIASVPDFTLLRKSRPVTIGQVQKHIEVTPVSVSETRKTDTPKVKPVKVSVIGGIEKLGKDPYVLIDKKPYPSEILYQISDMYLNAAMVVPAEMAIPKYGDKAKDGAVEIETSYGVFTTIAEDEQMDAAVQRSKDAGEVYTRIALKRADGTPYESIFISSGPPQGGGGCGVDVPPGGKVAIYVKGIFYNEKRLSEVSNLIKAERMGGCSASETPLEVNGVKYDATISIGY